jgi:hypothetical protein
MAGGAGIGAHTPTRHHSTIQDRPVRPAAGARFTPTLLGTITSRTSHSGLARRTWTPVHVRHWSDQLDKIGRRTWDWIKLLLSILRPVHEGVWRCAGEARSTPARPPESRICAPSAALDAVSHQHRSASSRVREPRVQPHAAGRRSGQARRSGQVSEHKCPNCGREMINAAERFGDSSAAPVTRSRTRRASRAATRSSTSTSRATRCPEG